MNLDTELLKLKLDIKSALTLKQLYFSRNDKKLWNYYITRFILFSAIAGIYTYIHITSFHQWIYNKQGWGFSIIIVLTIILTLTYLFILKCGSYASKRHRIPNKSIYSLKHQIGLNVLENWVRELALNKNEIEKYILPYIRREIEIKSKHSILEFLDKIIPSFVTGLSLAVISIFIFILNNDQEAMKKENINSVLNILSIYFLVITVIIIYFGIILRKALVVLPFMTETKELENIEKLIYSYLTKRNYVSYTQFRSRKHKH